MRFTQETYEKAIQEATRVADFSYEDLSGIENLTPDAWYDNLEIEEISFNSATLPDYFVKNIVSKEKKIIETYRESFGGSDRDISFEGVDFSAHTMNFRAAFTNFAGFNIERAIFKWPNEEILSVNQRTRKSEKHLKDLLDKMNSLMEDSKEVEDSWVEAIATSLGEIYSSHPFMTGKYYYTYSDKHGLIDILNLVENKKEKHLKEIEKNYSMGYKIKKFFDFGVRKGSSSLKYKKASLMIDQMKKEIESLKGII